MNSKIELKFKKIKEIQSKVHTDLCKLEDTYSSVLNPLNDLEKNKIKKDVDDLFKAKNDAFINTDTNKNYHNLFETFLSTIKNKKLPEKKGKKEINEKIKPKKIVQQTKTKKKEELKPVPVVEPSKRVENIVNQINKDEAKIDLKKKEKEILNHEIENLRSKLIEMNKKTKEIKDNIQKPTSIQNYKLIDKLIDGFTEALVVHWEDLVESLLDEILLEEVNILNSIEKEKKFSLERYEDYVYLINETYINSQKDRIAASNIHFKINDFREVFDEILNQEKTIKTKHNIY